MLAEITYDDLLNKVKELEEEASRRRRAEKRNEILEMQLRQAQKMEAIGMLAGGIAHDFNNILASIIGYAELSIEDVSEDSMVGANLKQILAAGKRARDLIRQILNFSRQSKRECGPVRLNPIVKEVSKMLRAILPSSIEIRTEICDKDLTVVSEPSQMYQILINLGSNAAQAMSDGEGLLEISLAERSLDEDAESKDPDMMPGQYAFIEVRDNGPGIRPDIIDQIFEPYFTTKDETKGTGLGLAVVKGIVQSDGGCISVCSRPGEGASFHIYLPLVETEEAGVDSEQAAALPSGTGKILFVDDEPIIVHMQKHILERLGYTVEAECSSRNALGKFRDCPEDFDVIVTDMTMPGMTGDQLAKEVKQIRPDMPVILCTGFSEKISKEEALEFGIDDYLLKPVEKATLAKTLDRVLKKTKNAAPPARKID